MRTSLVARLLATTFAAVQTGSGCAPLISKTVPLRPPASVLVVDAAETRDCLRSSSTVLTRSESEDAAAVDDPELAEVLESVPKDVRRTARAAGLEAYLARLLHEQLEQSNDRLALDVVALRLQVVMRISSLEIQLSSLTFEVGCMGRQMDSVLSELDRREQSQQLVLTVASIVVGAAAGIGAGVWELTGADVFKGPLQFGVAGGTVSAGLGIAGFVPRRGRVVYQHERNPLAPIVLGTDPDGIYPSFVFRMLTEPRPGGGRSSRDELVDDWRHIVDEATERDVALAEAILYGDGGLYDRNLIDAREKMLDALESELDGIDRDLELLYRYLAIVLEDPTGVPAPVPAAAPAPTPEPIPTPPL